MSSSSGNQKAVPLLNQAPEGMAHQLTPNDLAQQMRGILADKGVKSSISKIKALDASIEAHKPPAFAKK